jgi:hypothetical protein
MKAAPFAFVTLATQALPPLGIWLIATGCYAEPRRIPLAMEETVSLSWLGISAVLCWLLAGRASYRLLVECGRTVAVLLIAICCIPAWIAGAMYCHSLLVFAGLV